MPRYELRVRDCDGAASDGASLCFHCASPNPPAAPWRADVMGECRTFCCAGCLAIAQTIHAAGLDAFYASRDVPSSRVPDDGCGDAWDDAASDPALVRPLDGTRVEATLLLEGLRCGACAWLVESWLARQRGIESARVNFATARARVVWDDARMSLAQVLRAVRVLGYAAHPYDPERRETLARSERRDLLLRMAIALLVMMQVMMFAVPTYYSVDGIDVEHRALLDWASFTLTVPAIAWCALPMLRGAWRDVSHRRLGMDVPVALGLIAAFAASAWSTFAGAGPVYYDSVTMFIALLLVARYVELVGRQRAGEAIERVARARPFVAERLTRWPGSDAVEPVAAATLATDDLVLVRPGAIVPADGVVVDGVSRVEEAMLTGESWPRPKRIGDDVFAGAVNGDGALVVRVARSGASTRLAAIQRLVDTAAGERPRIARVADRFAAVFVAALFALAIVAALVWWQIDPSRVLGITFALLVVSCPCALSLATPAAVAAGVGALSSRHVLLARSDALETLAQVTHVVFDKTGTLTCGRVSLRSSVVLDAHDEAHALAIAGALEARSEHPIAAALKAAAPAAPVARNVTVVAGQGIEGDVEGIRYRIGRPAFVAGLAGALPQAAAAFIDASAADSTTVVLGSAQCTMAVFALGDALRPGARELVSNLVENGVQPVLLSGDRAACAAAVARQLGIDDARGDLVPEDKRTAVQSLQRQGAIVAMVGDGINDAPGLAQAQVSISLASGTPLAQWTSDAIVLSDALPAIAVAIGQARRTMRIVRQNLGWAFAYNAIAIPAAAFGYVTPLAAAAGMTFSSLFVVVNALRASRVVVPDEPRIDSSHSLPLVSRPVASR